MDEFPYSAVSAEQLAIADLVKTGVEHGYSTADLLLELSRAFPALDWTLDRVERTVRLVADRRPAARRLLESRSVDMARNLADKGKPADHARALEGLRVLDAPDETRAGVTVIIGGDLNVAIVRPD